MRNAVIFIIIGLCFYGCFWQKEEIVDFHSDTLHVYATEIFLNEDFYSEMFPLFENIFNCEVDTKIFPDVFAILDSLKNIPDSLQNIDIIFGLDNVVYPDIYKDSLLIAYEAKNLRFVEKKNLIDPTFQTTPVSFCQIGFIYNNYQIEKVPSTFGEMQDGIFKEKIILMNPRTSSLGRAMLIWSVAAFGSNGYGHFWRSVKENIYTVADNNDDAYNMFLAAQAPLVIGYNTTPVYHQIMENSQKYKTTIPSEGSYNYYLTAGIHRSTHNLEMSQKFIEFILSEDFQTYIPKRMWMYPVNKQIELGPKYELLPKSTKDYSKTFSDRSINRNISAWLKRWESIMLK
ncbi:MAG: thiamine ABC transporter substrate-binding protein [Candidatus Cloacimonetes bacterium]|nr:thiamine ABC transporter substrate-binding protein [Candidatus Cloacimonadota bacterium]MCF7813951.1 thiamine ABC transporter substrate-binding protein [Candidatus Cloacimonadota bacterium]MCF7868045.1 thiamine ABC transporter substrate-binding protein [Candidatus Cloacimonadota bacterium]MCF7883965.1 thiamine ABC transporter substrate-binding protein [Candidatus Cloacimonadota bacterium]